MKLIMRITKWVLLVVIAVLGALWLFNASDSKPAPGIAEFLRAPTVDSPSEKNGYFAMAGIRSPSGVDPYEWGKSRVESSAVPESNESDESQRPFPKPGSDLNGLCRPEKESCLQQVRREEAKDKQALSDFKVLLARYRDLASYSRFDVPQDDSEHSLLFLGPKPAMYDVVAGHQLALAEIAMTFNAGDATNALTTLSQDTTLLRKLLAGTDSMIVKVIAVNFSRENVLLLSEMLQDLRPENSAALEVGRQITQPLTQAERDLSAEFRDEFIAVRNRLSELHDFSEASKEDVTQLDSIVRDDKYQWRHAERWLFASGGVCAHERCDRLLRLFYQPTDTINRVFPSYQSVVGLEQPSKVNELLRLLGQDDEQTARQAMKMSALDMLYNPVGKWIASTRFSVVYTDYAARIHDLEGLLRLVALQIEVVANAVDRADMQKFLDSSPSKWHDPYTDKAVNWDADKQQLWFEPKSARFKADAIGGIKGRLGIRI